ARRRGRKRRPSRNAAARPTAVEKSLRLGIPHPPRDSHFPTAATTNFRLHFQCLDNPSQVTFLNGSTGGARRISAIRKRRGRKRLTTEITEGPQRIQRRGGQAPERS